jgi:cytochrome oxidase Cu insertion factor (SCO1/SenC/PrrC family)
MYCVPYVHIHQADESETDDEDYLVDHSIVFYLNGPGGEFLDFFSQNFTALDMTDKIEAYILNYINDHPEEAVAAAKRLEADRLNK